MKRSNYIRQVGGRWRVAIETIHSEQEYQIMVGFLYRVPNTWFYTNLERSYFGHGRRGAFISEEECIKNCELVVADITAWLDRIK